MSSEAALLVDAVGDALAGVLGTREGGHPLHQPEFRGNELRYVGECIETGWVSSVGSYVDRFEAELAERHDVPHAVATSTGTAALHVALILAGVEPGDEVLVPTLTFVATANAVSYTGARPHLVDAEERSLGVDPVKLAAHLEETAERRGDALHNRRTGARIRALVATHVFGHPCRLAELVEVADRFGLALVEDAAEALGSEYEGAPVGRHGRCAILSFNGNKIVTTGGGGALLTEDRALAVRAKHLTTTARVPHRFGYVHDEVGFNYRLPNLNAALGCAQLERLDDMLRRKRAVAERLAAALDPVDGVTALVEPEGTRGNYWLNALVLDPELAPHRDALIDGLGERGFTARPLWACMHTLPMYAECPRTDVVTAESLEARVVNLPSSAYLGDR